MEVTKEQIKNAFHELNSKMIFSMDAPAALPNNFEWQIHPELGRAIRTSELWKERLFCNITPQDIYILGIRVGLISAELGELEIRLVFIVKHQIEK